jgi:RNA-binding protein
MDPTVWIGKQGPTDELMRQVVTQLKTRELVKLKLLKSALTGTETEIIAEKVAGLTASTLVEVMGHTFTLFKRKEIVASEKRRDTTKPWKRYH